MLRRSTPTMHRSPRRPVGTIGCCGCHSDSAAFAHLLVLLQDEPEAEGAEAEGAEAEGAEAEGGAPTAVTEEQLVQGMLWHTKGGQPSPAASLFRKSAENPYMFKSGAVE